MWLYHRQDRQTCKVITWTGGWSKVGEWWRVTWLRMGELWSESANDSSSFTHPQPCDSSPFTHASIIMNNTIPHARFDRMQNYNICVCCNVCYDWGVCVWMDIIILPAFRIEFAYPTESLSDIIKVSKLMKLLHFSKNEYYYQLAVERYSNCSAIIIFKG